MKISFKIINLLLILILFLSGKSIAINEPEVSLLIDRVNFVKEEEFNVKLQIKNVYIAAFTIQIYFDSSKIEYISGPESSNYTDNRIVYTWFDETGGSNLDLNKTLGEFKFKAIQEGETKFVLFGEFYDANGNSINIPSSSQNIYINEKTEETNDRIEEKSSKENCNLKILRLNEEGITPTNFNKDITQYYFITDKQINSLEVTAIPENEMATVNVSGNKNLKDGLNNINIEVISEDKTNKKVYTISVTKTRNLDTANANLENLAIEGAILEPEYDPDILNYKAYISNKIDNLNILAVPEKINAKVEIQGKDNLQIGNNNVTIKVTAENGYTIKVYNIEVYKRNEEEQIQYQADKEMQARKLSTILDNNIVDSEEKNNKTNQKDKIYNDIIFLIPALIIIIVLIIVIRKKRKEN